ncbi:flagellar hook-basal body complex protein, partial [Aquabacterium sp. A08]|uniref:flagellar hook-basal body complex protein n=1 Tax=Aquabacterium sp. A08 TaxID=2718532 RepID=UPI00141E7F6D
TITQFGGKFGVYDLTQNGYAKGDLTSIDIGESGVILARYSNGVSKAEGMVALGTFRNLQGLQPVNGGYWSETFASGQAVMGSPQDSGLGLIRQSALEESNVDLTQELVNMIVAQRAYQANAQTIKTQDQVQQTLVNLR